MKNLILSFTILVFYSSYAQDSQLAGVNWYLQNLILNGQHHTPPQNSEVQYVEARFYAVSNGDGVDGFNTFVCNNLSGLVEYDSNNQNYSFLESIEVTLMSCNLQINEDFETVYFPFFDDNPGNLYNYTITTVSNGYKTLEITSNTGDQAIYGDHLLSNEEFYGSQFSIHPNPAKNELFLTSKNTTENLTIKIFNLEGKLLSTQNLDSEKQVSVDVSNLSSGIYFLDIEDGNGNSTIKKFVKE